MSSPPAPGEPGSLTRQHFDALRHALGPVDLTDPERAFLAWLAGMLDQASLPTVTGLFEKVAALEAVGHDG